MWPFKNKASSALSETSEAMHEASRSMSNIVNLLFQKGEKRPEVLAWLKEHENEIMEVENLPGGGFRISFPEKKAKE